MLGRFREALADAERALELAPGHPACLLARAEARRGLRDLSAARKDAAAAAAANPREAWPRVVAAKVEADARRHDAALRRLGEARRLAPRDAKVHGWRGETLRRMGRWEESLAALDESIRLDPECAWFYACRAQARAGLRDFAGGLDDFKTAVRLNPRCEAFHDMGGQAWLLAWRGEAKRSHFADARGAREDLDAAVRLDPSCAWALLSRAVARGEAADADGQLRDFAALARVAPGLIATPLTPEDFRREVEKSRHRVRRLVRARRFDEAVAEDPNAAGRADATLDRLIEEGDIAGALRRLDALTCLPPAWKLAQRGELLRQPALNRQSEAVRALSRAVALAPRSAWIRAFLGRARFHGADRRRGLADLDAAIALAPSAGWLYAWRGEALRQLGDLGGAHQDLSRAIALSPFYPWSYAWRGGVRRALGLWRAAAQDLDLFLSVVDSYPWARRERGEARLRLGDPGCLDDLSRAAAFDMSGSILAASGAPPADERRRLEELARAFAALDLPAARAWRGETLLRLGRPREALRELDAALRSEPRSAWAHAWRAEALAALRRFPEARAAADRCLELERRGYPRAHALRGWLLRREGDFLDAAADFARACGGRSTTSWCLALYGETLLRAGRKREAIEPLSKALELDPRHKQARRWLRAARKRS